MLKRGDKSVDSEIDFVIIWVDGSDPDWLKEKGEYTVKIGEQADDPMFKKWCDNPMRYRDWDILQYWFRGVEKFAPWVRKIHFVTWGHLPSWLNTEHPKLNIVNHKDFIPKEYLPTFQANPIEDNLHRIKGLSEQFVFFNDDMFIIKSTSPSDFFKNGLPCDCAILEMPKSDRYGTPCEINSAEVLNDHFSKNEVIKKHFSKWINLKYGKDLIRTILLMPWKNFGCLVQPHLPSSMLKSTYIELWDIEHDALDKTCRNRFRGKNQLTQYLFLDWQRVTGQFYPRSPYIGKAFRLGEGTITTQPSQLDEAINYIEKQQGKMVCINDGNMT